jgi:hypothetical protein
MVTAVIRWFLLSVATAAAVGIFYATAAMAGWSLGAASVYLIAASAFGCLAVTVVWYIRSRYSQPVGGIELRLDRIKSPSESSRRSQDFEVPTTSGTGERAASSEPLEDAADQVPIRDDDSDPLFEQRPTTAEPVPVEEDAGYQVLDSDSSGSGPASEQDRVEAESPSLTSAEAPHIPLEHLSLPALDTSDEASDEDAGDDAKRLAEVLNLYDHNGPSYDEPIDRSTRDPFGADHATRRRGLWNELVEEHGAASIDLRDAESGGCRITLSSGNLVFYAPERGLWVWVIFDRTEPTKPSPIDASPSAHIVTNPNSPGSPPR